VRIIWALIAYRLRHWILHKHIQREGDSHSIEIVCGQKIYNELVVDSPQSMCNRNSSLKSKPGGSLQVESFIIDFKDSILARILDTLARNSQNKNQNDFRKSIHERYFNNKSYIVLDITISLIQWWNTIIIYNQLNNNNLYKMINIYLIITCTIIYLILYFILYQFLDNKKVIILIN